MKVLIGILLLATLCGGSKNETAFVATDEWQEIGEGQAIPQGLHVRINLQTGKKEAKLLEDDGSTNDTSRSTLSTVPGATVQDHDVGNAERQANMEKLKEALQRIPTDDFKFDEEELKKVKAKYKSYEEIRQELKDAQLEVKTDSDIMTDLFVHFDEIRKEGRLNDAKTELEVIFEDLQYLVHQIDNAVDFINRQGIEQIIWPSLNQTESSTLKIHGFKLLGTVVQNNPKAKVALFERNGGAILLTKLSQSSDSQEVSAGLYALGSLLRKFPYAQNELLNPHGYSLLFDIFNKKLDLRVKSKVTKLVSDLVQDFEHGLTSPEVDSLTKDQYESTNLKENLLKSDYCNHARNFFHQNKIAFAEDENLTEEVVESLHSVSKGLCADIWSRCPLFRHTLLVLRNTLDTRLGELEGKDGEYLREVQAGVVRFLEELYGKVKESRDEL